MLGGGLSLLLYTLHANNSPSALHILLISMAASSSSSSSPSRVLFFLVLAGLVSVATGQVGLGSRLVARENRAWVSENKTFAFGLSPVESDGRYQLGIWFGQLPGDRTMVWSANR